MKFTIHSFADGSPVPPQFAFCIPSPDAPVQLGTNLSPHVSWQDAPAATASFVLLMHDPEVPSSPEDVNVEGRTVPYDLPRVDFYHWVLIDIPPLISELSEGLDSDGVTAKGKKMGDTNYGVRGYNDYTGWFSGNADMEGFYGGYDGPCPPWNDERIHRYIFTIYALDVPTLNMGEKFGGPDVVKAMEGHILDSATWEATYTLYPAAKL